MIVEVDGDVHDLQKEEDERREKAINGLCRGLANENRLRKFILIIWQADPRVPNLKFHQKVTSCLVILFRFIYNGRAGILAMVLNRM
ncbi:MAG: hypothetical protein IT309_08115 [Anaerolineales bacterium]|nr:hypothetical protein [Anaerolineales bacterium]